MRTCNIIFIENTRTVGVGTSRRFRRLYYEKKKNRIIYANVIIISEIKKKLR